MLPIAAANTERESSPEQKIANFKLKKLEIEQSARRFLSDYLSFVASTLSCINDNNDFSEEQKSELKNKLKEVVGVIPSSIARSNEDVFKTTNEADKVPEKPVEIKVQKMESVVEPTNLFGY